MYGLSPLSIWREGRWQWWDDYAEELKLSPTALGALKVWSDTLQATLDDDLRCSWSGFDTLEQLRAFRAEGKRVFKRIKRELGPGYKIVYDPTGDARVRTHEKPPKPKPKKRLGRDPKAGPHRAP